MKFSEKLYLMRKKSSLSQEQLAERLNVSRQAISKWEGGVAVPESEKLIAISEFFGISLDDLLKEDRSIGENNADKQKCEPPISNKRTFLASIMLSGFGAASLLTFGIWMLCSPASSQELAASSVITLDGRAIVMLVGALLFAFGIFLLLKTKRGNRK